MGCCDEHTTLETLTVGRCRNLKNDKQVEPSASIKLDEYAVTRLARFGEASDRLVAVAASKSIHTLKLRDDGSLEGSPPPPPPFRNPRYNLPGLIFVLQIWRFACQPKFRELNFLMTRYEEENSNGWRECL
jgi:hypothetical protein